MTKGEWLRGSIFVVSFSAGVVISVCMNRGFWVWMCAIAVGLALRLIVWQLFVALARAERARVFAAYDKAFDEAFAKACAERGITPDSLGATR